MISNPQMYYLLTKTFFEPHLIFTYFHYILEQGIKMHETYSINKWETYDVFFWYNYCGSNYMGKTCHNLKANILNINRVRKMVIMRVISMRMFWIVMTVVWLMILINIRELKFAKSSIDTTFLEFRLIRDRRPNLNLSN